MARRRNKVGLDTSCVIPLLCGWHEFHAPTIAAFGMRSLKNMVICTHVLLECFAVLTRLPPPYRIPPRQAEQLLTANFSDAVALCGVLDSDVWAAVG